MNDEMFLRPRARQVSLEAQRNASMQVEHLTATMGWGRRWRWGDPTPPLWTGPTDSSTARMGGAVTDQAEQFRRHWGWKEGRFAPKELMFISRTYSVPILILGGTGGLWMQRQNGYAAVLPCGLLPIQSVTESSSLLLQQSILCAAMTALLPEYLTN